ncbi:MAG: hypothetical protein ABJT31_11385 [Hyphomicrobiales bacterium]
MTPLRDRLRARKEGLEEGTGLVEVFGGLIAVLLIILVFISIQGLNFEMRARTDPAGIGDYLVHWDNEEFDGVMVTLSKGVMTVIEKQIERNEGDICTGEVPQYINETYLQHNRILLLFVTEGGVRLYREMRDCIFESLPNGYDPKIYFIMADKQVLRLRPIEEMPPEIQYVLEKNRENANR